MGTFRVPKISESQMAVLYGQGMARYDICLRAGILDHELVTILKRNGVPLRGDREFRRLAVESRARYQSTERMTRRMRKGG
jgi:hypothetical protein